MLIPEIIYQFAIVGLFIIAGFNYCDARFYKNINELKQNEIEDLTTELSKVKDELAKVKEERNKYSSELFKLKYGPAIETFFKKFVDILTGPNKPSPDSPKPKSKK